MKPFKVAIIGIGGVGGYIGARLAANRQDGLEVIFMSRGENLRFIAVNGLELITETGKETVRPDILTDNYLEIGELDLLVYCVKGYDLENSLEQIKPAITSKTIILPLLNGINAAEKIKNIYPFAKIIEGCIYLVSRLIAPGMVQQSGPLNQIYIGSDTEEIDVLEKVKSIFLLAGLNVSISEKIKKQLWEKYFFISSMATITSYYDSNMGAIQADAKKSNNILNLLNELKRIADAAAIETDTNLVLNTYKKIMGLPEETTSSMLSDFRKGGETEVEDITGYVVDLGKKFSVPTPVYVIMYNKLINSKPLTM